MTVPLQGKSLSLVDRYIDTLRYTAIFEEGEDGYIVVHVPALKGCHTQGKTREEALKNAKEVIEAYIASLRKHNDPIPEDVNAVVIDA